MCVAADRTVPSGTWLRLSSQFLLDSKCLLHMVTKQALLQAFEFSEWFLLQIHEHVHSCQYGNFLGNNQRQREELQ